MTRVHKKPESLPPAHKGRTTADVWKACFGHPCAHLPPPDYQALATEGGDVIGVANLYVRRVAGPTVQVLVGWMIAASVIPERQEQGIGRALVLSRHQWLRSRGVRFAALHCEETLVAHNEKLGYRRAPNMPGPGVAMVCPLTPEPFPDEPITFREPW